MILDSVRGRDTLPYLEFQLRSVLDNRGNKLLIDTWRDILKRNEEGKLFLPHGGDVQSDRQRVGILEITSMSVA